MSDQLVPIGDLEIFKPKPKTISFIDSKNSIVKFGNGACVKMIVHDVILRESSGHLWKMGSTYRVTAEGYNYANKYACTKQVPQDTLVYNGTEYSNPYITIDKFGRRKGGICRYTCMGYDASGEIQFSSVMVEYDINEEIIATVMSKTEKLRTQWESQTEKYKKDNPYQFLSKMTSRKGFESLDQARYRPYDLDDYTVLAVDMEHPTYFAVVRDIEDKRKTLSRKLQTVAKRNAIRNHPSLAGMYTVNAYMEKDPETKRNLGMAAKVKIVQWVDTDPQKEFESVQKWLKNEHIDEPVIKFTDEDDVDMLDEDYIPEAVVNSEVEVTEEEVEEVVENEDEKIRDELLSFISKSRRRLVGKFKYKSKKEYESMDIIELEAEREKIIEAEDAV